MITPAAGIAHVGNDSVSGGLRRLDIAGIGLVAFVLCCGDLVFPFGKDQGEYAAGAQALLAGSVLYRDIFCLKPPLTHAVHAVALVLFGHSMTSIRILDVLWQSATACCVATATSRATRSRVAGWVSGCVYAIMVARLEFFHSAETDGFLNLPVAIAIALFLKPIDASSIGRAFSVGVSIGVAVLFKYPIGILLPLLLFGLATQDGPKRGRYAVWMLTGSALPILAFVAWLVRTDALAEFVWIMTEVLPAYATSGAAADRQWETLAVGLRQFLTLPWSAFLLAFLSTALNHPRGVGADRRGRSVLLAWWIAGLVHVLVQDKFWLYQWSPLLAASSAVVGERAAALSRLLPGREQLRARLAATMLLAAIVAVLFEIHPRHIALVKVVAGRIPIESLWRSVRGRHFTVSGDLDVADWIRANTHDDDPIFIYGYHPTVAFLANRPLGSRFVFDLILRQQWGWQGARRRAIADLERSRPAVVVVVDVLSRDGRAELPGSPSLDDFPELRAFVRDDYAPVATMRQEGSVVIDHLTLFRRNEQPHSTVRRDEAP